MGGGRASQETGKEEPVRQEGNQVQSQGSKRTKCFRDKGVTHHLQCCWEMDRGLATGSGCLWVLVTLIQAVSMARRGQHSTGAGIVEVMSTYMHSFVKGCCKGLERNGAELEVTWSSGWGLGLRCLQAAGAGHHREQYR